MFSNASFRINQENVNNHMISNKVPEKSPTFSPINKSIISFSENKINIAKSNLDASLTQMEIVNTVKKAIELNTSNIKSHTKNNKENNSFLKSSHFYFK